MGAGAAVAAGIASGVTDLFRLGYDIWSNQRDFDYQKNLQNTIFAREDNAVQRRMADLKAAGLNPNLAAGSSAGAGAVVGRSNTSSLSGNPIGTALDAVSAVQQLRQQRTQNEILKNQKELQEYDKQMAWKQFNFDRLDLAMQKAALYKQLGINDLEIRMDDYGDVTLWSKKFRKGDGNIFKIPLENSPLMQQLDWQIQNNKNSADLLQKDVDWYTADKVGSYLGSAAQIFGAGASGYGNIMRGKYGYRRY